ncbi:MAG TPA: ABC transporter ATP-binding protein [Candidatus Limnocylindrales bacterium]|nr:ABC transporter ATP-binding protein [Candidatus Limnocylindrales bacterium]
MLLEINGLTKTYRRGGVPANDGITLGVDAGEVYGLLGHNGAGKTTLVNQVIGLARPDAGSIHLGGSDLVADPGLARRACSIQPQAQVPIDGLTPRQAIGLVGRLRGEKAAVVRRRTVDLARTLEIEEWLDTDGARLSGGVKRLVSFAMAAVAPGRLIILDEPTNDVDPVRRRHLWAQVGALADGGAAVLLVTHNVIEAERSVDRLAILDHGHVVVQGTPGELKASMADELRLDLALEPGTDRPVMPPFASRSIPAGPRLLVTVPVASAAEAATWAAEEQRAGRVEEFSLGPATLEDVYVALATQAEPSPVPAIRFQGAMIDGRAA